MKRVMIECPYTAEEKSAEYARACVLDSLQRGEAPVASIFVRALTLRDEALGLAAFAAGHAWVGCAEILAVYGDLGVDDAMRASIAMAERLGVAVEARSLRPESARPPSAEEQPRPSARPSRRG
jgi:hypothetical protein